MNLSEKKWFYDGYIFASDNLSSLVESHAGANYINSVNDAIETTTNKLNKVVAGYNTWDGQAGGDVAEIWHAETYNIDALLKGIDVSSRVTERNGSIVKQYAQPDIITSDGTLYGLKYYGNAYKTAMAQAETHWEHFNEKFHGTDKTFEDFLTERQIDLGSTTKTVPKYEGQMRLVPKDQLEKCIEVLKKKIGKKGYRGDDISGFQETLDKLTDRVKSKDGRIESIPLTKKESTALAQMAKKENVDLSKFGVSTEQLVSYEYILKKALNSGINAAVISMVLKVAPEIYKAIDKLIKDGKMDFTDFQNISGAAMKGSAQGFINGSIAAAITTACMAGKFGTSLKTINPTIVGTMTVIVVNTIVSTIKLSKKEISESEFALKISKDLFLSSCSIGLGTLTQTFLPVLPVAFLIGSFIGSLAGSFAYDKGYSKFMSLCCDTGFTCFGLVEQDYKIPDSVLKEMGIKTFEFKTFEHKTFEFKTFEFKTFEYKTFKYEKLKLSFMRREVIGVSKIGYVVAQ